MRQIMQRKSGVNLKEELKSLIYPISGPICVSEDEELFKNTMIAFYQHEQTVSTCEDLYMKAYLCRRSHILNHM